MTQLELLRLSLSLVVVVVLIFFAAWVARRSGLLRSKGQSIQIIATQSLGSRNSVVVIEIEQQRLVLGVTAQQITLLHTLPKHADFEAQLGLAITQQKDQQYSENNAP
ncbi:flagellar biosynthetic protein FliO [Paenalcaligenes faecalis]|uniref:flagellar biosynthetic protein FliO n=1 Tax=Paenalcaligenes faecalis TaxID=2980099 RepID=UPI0022B9AE3C|nr:flagellar biosynthetic protein FliO [Paenalcaligenes faecalis]